MNVYKNVPSSDLQKKEKKKKSIGVPLRFFFCSFFFLFPGCESVLLWNHPSSLENDKQLRTEDTDGFFLPGFEIQKLTFFFFFLPFGKCQADEPEALRLGLTALAASQPGSSYAWRKKKRKRNFPECLQIRI